MASTKCKDCPFKNNKTNEHCTVLFARKYKNSCSTYDVNGEKFAFVEGFLRRK